MKLKIFTWIFFILSVGLTFVSLSAGFYLYSALFTLYTATLICVVFEILRLSTLYAVSIFHGKARFIVSLLYVIIVCICFFASVISLDTQIIQKSNEHTAVIEKQIEADLYNVRHEYSKIYDEKLKDLNEKRDLFNRRLASNPKSKYYTARLQQVNEELDSLEKERTDKLNKLSFGNISREEIKTHLSILGIKDGGVYESKDISAFQEALNGLFKLDVLQLQKLIGYSLAFGIEAGILLLAILGFYLNNMNSKIKMTEHIIKEKPEEPKKEGITYIDIRNMVPKNEPKEEMIDIKEMTPKTEKINKDKTDIKEIKSKKENVDKELIDVKNIVNEQETPERKKLKNLRNILHSKDESDFLKIKNRRKGQNG